jgi:hypothetical protein
MPTLVPTFTDQPSATPTDTPMPTETALPTMTFTPPPYGQTSTAQWLNYLTTEANVRVTMTAAAVANP